MDVESSSEEDEDGDAALVAEDERGAEVAAAWGAGALAANPDEDVPLVSEDTSRCSRNPSWVLAWCPPSLNTDDRFAACRLALVDLDWDKLRAVDIFAALRSFLPVGGAIKRVTVYPSDYGLERMAQEAAEGPTVREACDLRRHCPRSSSSSCLSSQSLIGTTSITGHLSIVRGQRQCEALRGRAGWR